MLALAEIWRNLRFFYKEQTNNWIALFKKFQPIMTKKIWEILISAMKMDNKKRYYLSDIEQRISFVKVLGELGDVAVADEVVGELLAFLQDEDPEIRYRWYDNLQLLLVEYLNTLRKLGSIGTKPSTLQVLLDLAQNKQLSYRRRDCIEVLGYWSEKSSTARPNADLSSLFFSAI